MDDLITKGVLLKHYYLLGFTAAETLRKTMAFEGEGFVTRSVVYRAFKTFKADNNVTLPAEEKPIVIRKAKEQAEPKSTVTRKAKEQAEPKPTVTRKAEPKSIVTRKAKEQAEPKPTVTRKAKEKAEPKPTVTRKEKEQPEPKPRPKSTRVTKRLSISKILSTSTITTRSKAKKRASIIKKIQSANRLDVSTDNPKNTEKPKKSTRKVTFLPTVEEIPSTKTLSAKFEESVVIDKVLTEKSKKTRTSYALRSKPLTNGGASRVAKRRSRVIRKSFRFADTRNEGPLCHVKIVDFEADYPYALRKSTRQKSMFNSVL